MADPTSSPLPRPKPHHALLAELPLLLMLVLVFIGVAITSVAPTFTIFYWQAVTLLFAIICIYHEWPRQPDQATHWRLAAIQIAHWGAIFLAMRLLLMQSVRQMLNTDAVGLGVLALLALGTLLAGVHAVSWQIIAVGLLLALGIPAIAWLEQATLLITATFVLLAAGAAALAWQVYMKRRT